MGCFARGTKVRTPTGEKPIEEIRPNDIVLGVNGENRLVPVKVLEAHETKEIVTLLKTRLGVLMVTATQPLKTSEGSFKWAGQLDPGDMLIGYDSIEPVLVSIEHKSRGQFFEPVYHLSVEKPHTYIAGDVVAHNKGGGGGSSTTTSEASIAPELRPLFAQTGSEITRLQPGILDPFIQPQVQFIPQARPGQLAVLERQRQRAQGPFLTPQELAAQEAFLRAGGVSGPESIALAGTERFGLPTLPEVLAADMSSRFGQLTLPEMGGLNLVSQFTGGEIGQSPVTQAAIRAAREPILNELAMAGLGRSGAIGPALEAGFAPILAEEVRTRANVIPQLFQVGQQLRGGDIAQANLLTQLGRELRGGAITASNIQAEIGNRIRQGDISGAMQLAELGRQFTDRESRALTDVATSEEAVRQLEAQQAEALIQDILRRQAIALNLTTGVLGGFPAIGGQTSTTRQKSSGGGGIGK